MKRNTNNYSFSESLCFVQRSACRPHHYFCEQHNIRYGLVSLLSLYRLINCISGAWVCQCCCCCYLCPRPPLVPSPPSHFSPVLAPTKFSVLSLLTCWTSPWVSVAQYLWEGSSLPAGVHGPCTAPKCFTILLQYHMLVECALYQCRPSMIGDGY